MDGFRPRVWHVTNVLIHLAVVLLAWQFSRRILARAGLGAAPPGRLPNGSAPEKGKGKGRRAAAALPVSLPIPEWPALAAAALFALHPLSTEAVSYISQRSEALASGLVLGALLAVLAYDATPPDVAPVSSSRRSRSTSSPSRRSRWPRRCRSCGSSSRRSSRRRGARARVARADLAPAAPRRAARLPVGGRGLRWRPAARGSGHAGFDLTFVTPLQYVATQLRALPIYVRLVLFPSGLNADWQFPFSRGFLEPAVLAGAAFVAALVGGAFLLVRRYASAEGEWPAVARVAAFGVLFFLGMLAPTALVPLRDPFVEHRLYLATLGIVLAIVAACSVALRRLGPARGRAAGTVLALAAVAALGAATAVRNEVWQSALALWGDASKKSPEKPRIWVNYGTALHFAGRYDEAVKAYDRALSFGFDPTVPVELVVRNTALALVRLRRYDEARSRLESYLQRAPRDGATLVILALVEVDTGRLDEAERAARQALALDPRASRRTNPRAGPREARRPAGRVRRVRDGVAGRSLRPAPGLLDGPDRGAARARRRGVRLVRAGDRRPRPLERREERGGGLPAALREPRRAALIHLTGG